MRLTPVRGQSEVFECITDFQQKATSFASGVSPADGKCYQVTSVSCWLQLGTYRSVPHGFKLKLGVNLLCTARGHQLSWANKEPLNAFCSSLDMFDHLTDRRASYKTPPTVVTDRLLSQEARRAKVGGPSLHPCPSSDRGIIQALEEQKRVCETTQVPPAQLFLTRRRSRGGPKKLTLPDILMLSPISPLVHLTMKWTIVQITNPRWLGKASLTMLP